MTSRPSLVVIAAVTGVLALRVVSSETPAALRALDRVAPPSSSPSSGSPGESPGPSAPGQTPASAQPTPSPEPRATAEPEEPAGTPDAQPQPEPSWYDDDADCMTARVIEAGHSDSLLAGTNGRVSGFGHNFHGELGDGSTDDRDLPVYAVGIDRVTALSIASDHTVALRADGTVWTWGANRNGQLGDGTTDDRAVPARVDGLADVVAVAAGDWHTVAVRADGTVWEWGTADDVLRPQRVSGVDQVTKVAAGDSFTVALRSDGTVWTWGYFRGVGARPPGPVAGLTGIVDVAAGWHSLALAGDGTLWAWGPNDGGQLGDGTTTDRAEPVRADITEVVAVDAVRDSSIAVRRDGTVWSWGSERYATLGEDDDYVQVTPAPIGGLEGIVDVADGDPWAASLALDGDGVVWGWGWIPDRGDGRSRYAESPEALGCETPPRVPLPTLEPHR